METNPVDVRISASSPPSHENTASMVKVKHNRSLDNGHNSHIKAAKSSVLHPDQLENHSGKGGQIVGKKDAVMKRRSEINLLISVGGIYGCYLLSGLLQEDIYVYRSQDGGRFTYTFFLLWIQCAVNCCFSFVSLKMGESMYTYAVDVTNPRITVICYLEFPRYS